VEIVAIHCPFHSMHRSNFVREQVSIHCDRETNGTIKFNNENIYNNENFLIPALELAQ